MLIESFIQTIRQSLRLSTAILTFRFTPNELSPYAIVLLRSIGFLIDHPYKTICSLVTLRVYNPFIEDVILLNVWTAII